MHTEIKKNTMGFHGLPHQPQFMTLAVLVLSIFASASLISAKPMNFTTITKHLGCIDRCGNLSIPYPFGTTEDCYKSDDFFVTCNHTFDPPKLFLHNSSIGITNISLDGQLKILQFLARDCYNSSQSSVSYRGSFLRLSRFLTVSDTANKFTIVGCDSYGFVSGPRLNRTRPYRTGCSTICFGEDDLAEGSCKGSGCCQTSVPEDAWEVTLTLRSYENYANVSGLENCSYAFISEESAFTFSRESLTNLRDVDKLPMVIDWVIGYGTCEGGQKNSSSYGCKSDHSKCDEATSGNGYRCSCWQGYEGNPYITGGCQDVNECEDPNLNDCEKDTCVNKPGVFDCVCPKGYHGDGKRSGGRGCIRGESLVFKLSTGIALGVIILLLGAYWLHLELKSRRLMSMRQKWFYQNGGLFLQQELTRRERSPHTPKIFTAAELEKATENFNDSMIIGQGGYGTVYKGLLTNNQIVAIKKSKEVDPNQAEQFANEVLVLSQINHRNVVKLLGICLETQVPLLVYEFINNGTLYEHIHNKAKSGSLYWDMRLKIATETAAVLSYLHSAASTPIIHRDVKTANILLDHTFTAKVSDFGASRLAPLDHMQLSTMVQGTFGYLDPEYMQSSQLTEKSDVYSFGVVLVELLTGMKPLSYDRPEEERNLASFFLSVMRKESLFQVVESNILSEGNKKKITEVALLARSCLNMRGNDRPSMKEVAMELEGLRLGGKHSWSHKEDNAEEMESLLSSGYSGFIDEGNSTTIGFDSLKDHMIPPEDGGR